MPLEELASLTAALTVANVTALQLLRQVAVAAAEKKWLQSRRIRLLVLRVQLRGNPPATAWRIRHEPDWRLPGWQAQNSPSSRLRGAM